MSSSLFSVRPLVQTARRFRDSRAGSISLMAALLLPSMIGVVALVGEFGHGLQTKTENQRIADVAAYAGAVAYGVNGSESEMLAAARGVGLLNNVAAADISAVLVASPRTSDAKAVEVTIATTQPLALSRIMGAGPDLTVASKAFAEVGTSGEKPACILALDTKGSGITLSGGTGVQAPNCAVTSNAQIKIAWCGPKISAKAIQHVGKLDIPNTSWCNSFSGDVQKISPAPDPFAEHKGVHAAAARLATVSAMAGPQLVPPPPTTPAGPDLHFGEGSSPSGALPSGCSANRTGKKWTVTCTSSSIRLGKVTVQGDLMLDFNVSRSADYVFTSNLHVQGGVPVRFGPGTFRFEQGLWAEGDVTFGAGKFDFGAPPAGLGCGYSICVGGSRKATFAGPSQFKIVAGFDVGGEGLLSLGAGQTNSLEIGPAKNGRAISLQGSGTAYLGSESVDQTLLKVSGNVTTGGSSCLVFGKSAQHDIKGNLTVSGGLVMGPGVYSLTGYFDASQGGTASCAGKTVGGTDVTLVLGGSERMTSWPCAGQVFCLAGGYSDVTFSAPKSGALSGFVVVGPQSTKVTGGAILAGGAQNTSFSGALYFPNGPITLEGGASAKGNSNGCLMLVGSQVTLSGGTTVVSECAGLTGGGGGTRKISLVQ